MQHFSVLLLRHRGTGVTHYPIRLRSLLLTLISIGGLVALLLSLVVWQALRLQEQEKWVGNHQSQQIHLNERLEIAASQAERVQVLENRVQEMRGQLATYELHLRKKGATEQNILYQIRELHRLMCQQGSYQCKANGEEIAKNELDSVQWLVSLREDFHHLTLSQKANQSVPLETELQQEELWDLRQRLANAEQGLAEYAVLMQAREQEVRQLAERIQEITGIRLVVENQPMPPEVEGGRGGPFLEEALLPPMEEHAMMPDSDPRVMLEQELNSYHSTHLSLQRLHDQIRSHEILWRSTPTIAPVMDVPISSHYGRRRDPFTSQPAFHNGTDFSAPIGTPIHAPADGIVKKAGPAVGYGILVELEHGKGVSARNFHPVEYITRFGHLSRVAVQENQPVRRGQIIGYVGNTGRSTNSHLHYEIHANNRAINPWRNLSHFTFSR